METNELIGIAIAIFLTVVVGVVAFIENRFRYYRGYLNNRHLGKMDSTNILDKNIKENLEIMQDALNKYKVQLDNLVKLNDKNNAIIEKQNVLIKTLKDANIASALKNSESFPKGYKFSERKIVCLCGSTKFKEAFKKANREETAKGNIVLTVAMFGHLEGLDMDSEEKKTFDAVHYDKIKLADEVLVINTDNYIGESTRKEIEYAQSLDKPIRLLYKDGIIEEKNRGFSFERHNLSRDEIIDVLFYKAKEFYNTKENSMPSSLVIEEITVDSFGDHYCNDILYVWISLHRTVESAVIALLGKEKYKRDKLFDYKAACVEISKEDILRLRKVNEPIEGVNNYASVAIID